ncbi:M20 family peptidase [Fervidibacillus albus]|uniref:M20 family peptidase n=1 Tax=Fervidibacillus albus TaxID=2980026 RepID=A0A9E8LSA5_9BACI|nr:M20 family peptidase [Fervidibacillus albus]WAA08616.1 M20 family peptidase [Fervidibacillus albus]
MEFTIFFILFIVGIFIIITLFNLFTVKSKQLTPVPTTVTFDGNKAVSHLSEAITYKTISYKDKTLFDPVPFHRFLTFLHETYAQIFEQLEVEVVNQFALIFRWHGEDASKKPIGLTAHYDVVPVLEGTERNWKEDPFGGKVENGIIWGRGTLDDKTSVIAIFEAIQYLMNNHFQPKRDLYFMVGFDEEIGGEKGAKAIVETLQAKGVQFDFILDEGGAIVENMVPGVNRPIGVVGISEKGFATAELTAKGSGGHSSQPSNPTNIGKIARAIAKLEEKQFEGDLRGPSKQLFEYVAPEMELGMKYIFANQTIFKPMIENILVKKPSSAALIRTTIAPTIFQAGEAANVLPEKATAIINLRLMPGDTIKDVKSFIEKTIDDPDVQVSVTGTEATKVSSTNGWQFQTIQQAARNVYPEAIIAPYLMFGASDARHYDLISDETYRFLPVHITSEDLNRMHGTNEHISVENFLNAIKFYIELLKEVNK